MTFETYINNATDLRERPYDIIVTVERGKKTIKLMLCKKNAQYIWNTIFFSLFGNTFIRLISHALKGYKSLSLSGRYKSMPLNC